MIQIKNVSLAFGAQKILDDLSWIIKPGEKIGLVGPNGAGKTTLLKLIVSEIKPDLGSISMHTSHTISYLPQEVNDQNTKNTVLEEALGAFKEISELEREAERITEEMKLIENVAKDEYKRLLAGLDRIQNELAASDAHRIQYRAEKLLMGLGFEADDLSKTLDTFSGGWRMRVALSKLLLRDPEVILLDEPTNHLDIESIEWFEEYLKTFVGTVVLVSHDRYFLDRMIEKIAELAMGKITEYHGNYSHYLEERKSRIALHKSAYENQQREIRQTERFIERFRYKNTKASQVQSRIKSLEKMDKISPPPTDIGSIHFKFPEPPRSGKRVLEISAFSKSYRNENGDINDVFNNTGPLLVTRGDKIALVGKNAAGKSTLARIVVGTEPFEGERKVGYQVEITHFEQHKAESLSPSNTIIEEMESHADGEKVTKIRSLLGAFLFSGDDVYKPISVLSGGEKSRVSLAKTLLSPTNFLILDEPTNHLDIQSRTVLVEALKQYSGTLIVISHDRHFLDQIANKVWQVRKGKIYVYPGTYSEFQYKQKKDREGKSEEDSNLSFSKIQNNNKAPEVSKPSEQLKEEKRRKAEERNRRYNELMEHGLENMEDWRKLSTNQLIGAVVELEQKIKGKEDEKSEMESLLHDPEFFEDKERSDKVTREYTQLQNELKSLYDRWTSVTLYLESQET